MVNQTLLSELNTILKEEYNVTLPPEELVEVANALVGIFELLSKMDSGMDDQSATVNRQLPLNQQQVLGGGETNGN